MTNESEKTHFQIRRIKDVPYFGHIITGLFLLIGYLIYSTAIAAPFIWDDVDLVTQNENIKSWSHFIDLFKGNVVKQSSFYRPIQMFSYLLDYQIWNLNPKGYHLTSILLHICTALSLCWLVLTLFNDRVLGVLTGLLFLIHPIHNEAVVYISGRADPLVGLFMLLCITFYIRYQSSVAKIDYVLSVLTFVLALLSKEYALILPGLLFVLHFSFRWKIKGSAFYVLLGMSAIYFLLRMTNIVGVADMHSKTQTILLQRLPGTFFAIYEYFRLLVWPNNLYLGYGQKLFYWNDFFVWMGLAFYVFMIVIGFIARKRSRLISFAIFWYLIALLPIMNVYPVNAYMAEHWLYIPSMGVFLLIAWALQYAYQRLRNKDLMIATISALVLVLAIVTVRQNIYWQDPVVFYERIVKINPRFIKAYNNLGKIYSSQGDYEKAATYFRKTFEVEPRFEKGYHNYAVCMAKMFQYDEAVRYYKKALEVNPNFAPTYNNLGALYIDREKYDMAEKFVAKALSIKSDIPKAYYNMGVIEQKRGDMGKAVKYFQMALSLDPNYAAARNNIGGILSQGGKTQKAIQYYEDILKREPENYSTLNNLGVLYGKIGRLDKSIDYFAKALSIKGDYADAHFNIGFAFAQKKSFGQAMRHYQDAIKYDAEHSRAINNLAILYAGQGRYQESEQLLEKALSIDSQDISTHNNLGLVMARQKKYKQATGHYLKVLMTNPEHKETHNNLGMLYDELGNIKKAEEHYLQALKLDPQFTNALNGLGIVYGKSKRYEEAERLFIKALEINPNGLDALNNLKRARSLMKQEGI